MHSESFCALLLDCLLSATDYDSSALWKCVVDHVAPLEVLRHTFTLWAAQEGAQSWASEAAQALCLLEPALCCDGVQRIPPSPECPADVPPGGKASCALVGLGLALFRPLLWALWALPHPG